MKTERIGTIPSYEADDGRSRRRFYDLLTITSRIRNVPSLSTANSGAIVQRASDGQSLPRASVFHRRERRQSAPLAMGTSTPGPMHPIFHEDQVAGTGRRRSLLGMLLGTERPGIAHKDALQDAPFNIGKWSEALLT